MWGQTRVGLFAPGDLAVLLAATIAGRGALTAAGEIGQDPRMKASAPRGHGWTRHEDAVRICELEQLLLPVRGPVACR